MASAAAAPAQESEGDGRAFSHPNEPASVSSQRPLHAAATPAALQHHQTQSKENPPGVCWGNGGKNIGDEEEGVRSMADVIAEAMRENSVQHGVVDHQVELCEGFWPRPVVRSQSPSADLSEVTSAAPPSTPATPALLAIKESAARRTDFDVMEVASKASGHQDGVMARAMAEAILADGSYVTSPVPNGATPEGTMVPPARGNEQPSVIGTNGMRSVPRIDTHGQLASEASSSAPRALDKQDVGGTHAVPVDTNTASEDPAVGACPARGESGGVAAASAEPNIIGTVGPEVAPFGHAVIIEEHVRATEENADGNVLEECPGIDMGAVSPGRVVNKGVPTAVNGGKFDAEVNDPSAAGYSGMRSEQACFELGAKLEQERRAVQGGRVGREAPMRTPQDWKDESAAEGFLVLNGRRNLGGVDALPSLAGAAARVGAGAKQEAATTRANRVPSGPDSSPPEEYIILHEQEKEEHVLQGRGDCAEMIMLAGCEIDTENADNNVDGNFAAKMVQGPQHPARSVDVRLHQTGVSGVENGNLDSSTWTMSHEPTGEPSQRASENTEKFASVGVDDTATSSFVAEHNAVEERLENPWPPSVQGAGLSEALGGWGEVTDTGRPTNSIKPDNHDGHQEKSEQGPATCTGNGRLETVGLIYADYSVDCGDSEMKEGEGNWDGFPDSNSVAPAVVEDQADEDNPVLYVFNDHADESLDGLPGERSLYVAGDGGRHDDDDRDVVDGMHEGEPFAHNVAPRVGWEDIEVTHSSSNTDLDLQSTGCGQGSAEESEDHQGDAEEDVNEDDGDTGFDHSWDDLVEGVADEGVLHGHGRGGLPDPLFEDALADEIGIEITNGGTLAHPGQAEAQESNEASYDGPDQSHIAGGGSGSDGAGVGGRVLNAVDGVRATQSSDDGYQSGCEGRPGLLSSQKLPVGGPLASRSSNRETLVSTLAKAVGARTLASPELLAHFIRAGGGDVDKAVALYLSIVEEFVEFRDMARRRRDVPPPPPSPPQMEPAAERAVGAKSPQGNIQDGGCDRSVCSDAAVKDGMRNPAGGILAGAQQPPDSDFPWFEADPKDIAEGRDEYSVTVSSQKLGMTVENVLERTVVRAAAPGGGAESAGVETDSLVVALDGQSTKDSSHFEVIELLRIADRPLTLRLRRVARQRLSRRRAEMRALTRPQGILATGTAGVGVRGLANAFGGTGVVGPGDATSFHPSSINSSAHPLPGSLPTSVPFSGVPSSPPPRILRRQDAFMISEPDSPQNDAEGNVSSNGDGGDGGDARAAGRTPSISTEGEKEVQAAVATAPVGTATAGAAAEDAIAKCEASGGGGGGGGINVGVGVGATSGGVGGTREQISMSSSAAGLAGNWEAVEWAESCLLTILRLMSVGGEVCVSEKGKQIFGMPPNGNPVTVAGGDGSGSDTFASTSKPSTTLPIDVTTSVAHSRKPVNGAIATDAVYASPGLVTQTAASVGGEPSAGGEQVAGAQSSFTEGVPSARDAERRAAEIRNAGDRAAGGDSSSMECLQVIKERDSIIRLLLDFSGLLERDWCVSRHGDSGEGDTHEGSQDDLGAGVGQMPSRDSSGGPGTIGRRIEHMGAIFEQLIAVINWDSEYVAAVEPQLRELLCVLLDADLGFDLSSNTYPHLVGGAVAAALKELLLHLPLEQAAIEAPALAHRLAMSNSVCARGACCALVAQAYNIPPPPRQLQLRGILTRLLHDRAPGVRGEAVKALAFVATVADSSAGRWMLMLGEIASLDPDLTVRRASVYTLLQIGHRLLAVLEETHARAGARLNSSNGGVAIKGASETNNEIIYARMERTRRETHMLRCKLLPMILRLARDDDWQVRVEIACRLDSLCVTLGDQWSLVTVNVLPALVRDADHDVRCEAVRCLPRLARILLGFAMSVYAGAVEVSSSSSGTTVEAGGHVAPAPSVPSDSPEKVVEPHVSEASSRLESNAADGAQRPVVEGSADSLLSANPEAREEYAVDSSTCGEEKGDPQEVALEDPGIGRQGTCGGAVVDKDVNSDGGVVGAGSDGMSGDVDSVSSRKGVAHRNSIGGLSWSPGRMSLHQAGQKAQRDILNALMPPAATLVEDPSSEVRGTAAVSLGEMLRLLVGFEDYVTALWSARGGSSGGGRSGGYGSEGGSFGGVSPGMETCCCVTGEDCDSDALDCSFEVYDQGGFRGGARDGRGGVGGFSNVRRVCHGNVLQAAMAAAAATADANAEAVMAAELMDLEDFDETLVHEQDHDGEDEGQTEDNVVEGTDGHGDGAAVEIESHELPFANEQVNGDQAHDNDSLSVVVESPTDDKGRSWDNAGEPSQCSNSDVNDAGLGQVGTPVVNDGVSVSVVSNLERREETLKLLEPGTNHVPDQADEADHGHQPPTGRQEAVEGDDDDDSAAASDESLNAVHGNETSPTGLSDMSIPVAEDDDDDSLDPHDFGAAATGDHPTPGSGSDNGLMGAGSDPLIIPVTRLLNDGDAHVACTMLQALRPAWIPELGPGPSPQPFTGPDSAPTVGVAASDAPGSPASLDTATPLQVSEVTSTTSTATAPTAPVGGARELRQAGRSVEALAHRRSCMLTPAQIVCVLPALAELHGSSLWRVRAAVAESLPALVSCTLCDRLKDEVMSLGRRMLFDRVDAVRKATAEQLVMAARIDLERCPWRLRHHMPGGACYQSARHLPDLTLSPRCPSSPLPPVDLRLEFQPAYSQSCPSAERALQSSVQVVTSNEVEMRQADAISSSSARQPVDGGSALWGLGDGDDATRRGSGSGDGHPFSLGAIAPQADTPVSSSDIPETPTTIAATDSEHHEVGGVVATNGGGKGWTSSFGESQGDSLDRTTVCGLWLRLVLVPLMRECLEGSYRGRLLALHMTQALFRFGVTTPAVMSSVVVPTLMRGLSDTLPNVRLTAARIADDILKVAAMSSWPPPTGRGNYDVGHGDSSGCGDGEGAMGDGTGVPAEVGSGRRSSQSNTGRDGVSQGGDASSASAASGGDARVDARWGSGLQENAGVGWGCGWAAVETRLEALSKMDPDRDVSYFASQAVKPKWVGDRTR